MYIRRKVFSRFEDENGNERLFSTTEFQKEFGNPLQDILDEEAKVNKFENSGRKMSRREMDKNYEETLKRNKKKEVRDKIDAERLKNNFQGSEEEDKLQAQLESLSPAGKENMLKRLYGKDAAHRGRNIALTGAAVAGLGAAGYGVHRAIKKKKAKKEESKRK